MQRKYTYHLVNVFAEEFFGGNPLAVFTDADEITKQEMQLIARQFNLAEVVFFQTATESKALKKLRIFTPDYELPFAGHPTIGSSFVLQQLLDLKEKFTLETNSGLVEITYTDNLFQFALNREFELEKVEHTKQYAEILSLNPSEIVDVSWVNTGTKQLLVKVATQQAVEKVKVNAELFNSTLNQSGLYVWNINENHAKVRFFFAQQSAVVEDVGTGSAAANLGGWLIRHNLTPVDLAVTQGDEIERPNRLSLKVDDNQTIFVGGQVIKVGQGEFYLP